MKLVTHILALMVIILSLKPGIDAMPLFSGNDQCCAASACIPVSDIGDPGDKDDSEDRGICNPFKACGSCLLICEIFAHSPQSTTDLTTEHHFGYGSLTTCQLISDFWQPPRRA